MQTTNNTDKTPSKEEKRAALMESRALRAREDQEARNAVALRGSLKAPKGKEPIAFEHNEHWAHGENSHDPYGCTCWKCQLEW